jgi:hypothetical protein
MAIPKTSSVPQPTAGQTTTSTSSTTTTAEAKPQATLKLISLLCERRNDVFGVDEASIWVNGEKVWADTIAKGQTVSLVGKTVDFEGVASVAAKERDGEKYQKIGDSFDVDATGHNQNPLDFKTSGTHYVLYYDLKKR